jgi:uncharacterized protein (TIGR04255 family)
MLKVINTNPLTAPPPPEVPLKDTPLVRVIAQLRFPPILSINSKDFVASFQEAIREEYPILQPIQAQSLILNTDNAHNASAILQTTWCFWDTNRNWRISLANNAVAIETTKYTSRSEFLSRLKTLLTLIHSKFHLSQVDRFGMRYIDRVSGENLNEISLLIRPEMAGIVSTDLQEYMQQVLHESLFVLPLQEAQIAARWGKIPGNVTFDPYSIEAITEPSWILDLDMSSTKEQEFSIDSLMQKAHNFTERLYTFFRWVVNDEFLRRYGGEL